MVHIPEGGPRRRDLPRQAYAVVILPMSHPVAQFAEKAANAVGRCRSWRRDASILASSRFS
jgi:hypothetical protein